METAKVAISINKKTLKRLDRLVKDLLARECAKLDPVAEQAMAEEGLSEELSGWPEY